MIDAIVEEIVIRASANKVFDALTQPEARVKWWYRSAGKFEITRVESDLRPGGRWVMHGTGMGGKPLSIAGTYLTVERPHLLSFTWLPDWQEDGAETVVRWDLTEESQDVTKVRLTHTGFTTDASRATYRGWPLILGGLQAHVEATQ